MAIPYTDYLIHGLVTVKYTVEMSTPRWSCAEAQGMWTGGSRELAVNSHVWRVHCLEGGIRSRSHRESECARASARDWLVRESERALAASAPELVRNREPVRTQQINQCAPENANKKISLR